jgi:ABC-type transport system involved in multi-copper enzyme maturation permease subunit
MGGPRGLPSFYRADITKWIVSQSTVAAGIMSIWSRAPTSLLKLLYWIIPSRPPILSKPYEMISDRAQTTSVNVAADIFMTRLPIRILAIAQNAFREAVRDRILYNLILFVLLITVSAVFLGELTAGQEAKVIADLGLSAILIFGTFIAIFVGVGLVSKEIEKRTVYSIFSKPVGRGEFIVGKYLGLCLTILVNVFVMGLGISFALLYVGGNALAVSVWPAIFLIFLELTIINAVAIMFSSFSTPALSALLTFFIFVIGHFSSSLRDLAGDLGSHSTRLILDAIYYVLPNLSHFSFITETANGIPAPAAMVGLSTAYAIAYDIILLTITVLIFARRNFK